MVNRSPRSGIPTCKAWARVLIRVFTKNQMCLFGFGVSPSTSKQHKQHLTLPPHGIVSVAVFHLDHVYLAFTDHQSAHGDHRDGCSNAPCHASAESRASSKYSWYLGGTVAVRPISLSSGFSRSLRGGVLHGVFGDFKHVCQLAH